jgi:hypothetical protein
MVKDKGLCYLEKLFNFRMHLYDIIVGQLRGGGVNQLLPCLNNYASFKTLCRNTE